jgi:excisionase family DNA binding protein
MAARAREVAMTQLPLPFPDGRDEYLTVAEAAVRLRCCERTIRRAIESGALRAGRVRGGRVSRGAWRIRAADLDAWLFDDAAETG